MPGMTKRPAASMTWAPDGGSSRLPMAAILPSLSRISPVSIVPRVTVRSVPPRIRMAAGEVGTAGAAAGRAGPDPRTSAQVRTRAPASERLVIGRLQGQRAGGAGRGTAGARAGSPAARICCEKTGGIVASRAVRRWSPFILVAVLLGLVGGALSPSGRAGIEAMSLLFDVWSVAREGGTAGPPWTTITYAGPAGGDRRADLHCDPSSPPRARLLLAHGLVETGKDDSRLRALGRAFARHRFLVMVPDFPGMRALRVGRGDIDEVAAAIEAARRVAACPPAGAPTGVTEGSAPPTGRAEPPGLPTGAVGFSYSAGPV